MVQCETCGSWGKVNKLILFQGYLPPSLAELTWLVPDLSRDFALMCASELAST